MLLRQAVDVSDADDPARAFYAALLRGCIVAAPLICILHAFSSARRRRAAEQQEALAAQLAAAMSNATAAAAGMHAHMLLPAWDAHSQQHRPVRLDDAMFVALIREARARMPCACA